MTSCWQPSVAGHLDRVGRDRILNTLREGAGVDAERQIVKKF
jgi:hypothetical protein